MTADQFADYCAATNVAAQAARRSSPNRYDAANDRQYLLVTMGDRRFKLHFSEAHQDAVFALAYKTGTEPGWAGDIDVFESSSFAYGVDAVLEWEEWTGLGADLGLDLLLMAL